MKIMCDEFQLLTASNRALCSLEIFYPDFKPLKCQWPYKGTKGGC